MRSSLGLLIVSLAVVQLVAVWSFALPRLMGVAGSSVVAVEQVLEAPAPVEDPIASEEPPLRPGAELELELDALHRPW